MNQGALIGAPHDRPIFAQRSRRLLAFGTPLTRRLTKSAYRR